MACKLSFAQFRKELAAKFFRLERRTLNATHGRVCGFVAFKVHKAF
jgi:hypothetical protein